jgi:O-antigen/teichoic acid export membrane protein
MLIETAGEAVGRDRLETGGGLWGAFARSVRSNLIGEFGVQAARIAGLILLARLLLPTDFGILRILIAITLFATMITTIGLPEALIQRAELTEEHEATGWWMSLGVALTTAVAMYLSAPLIARVMAMPPLTQFIRLLSIPISLSGTTVIANARLRRRLQFSAIATADVLAEIGFLVTAIVLFAMGFARWSLAGGLAARVSIQTLTLSIVERYWPRRTPTMAAARDLMGFASPVLGARLLVVLAGNADYLMVGRLLGSSALGFYGMAWDLLRFIPDRLYSVVGRVTLPAFCRLQDDRKALAQAYCGFTNYIARLILPFIACAAIAAPQFIGVVYGAQWIPAATPMRLLSAGLALLGLRMAIGSVYFASGRPSFDIYVHALRLLLIVLVVGVTARFGLVAVSAGMGLVEASISMIGQLLVCRLLDLKLRMIAAAAIPGLRVAALCALAAGAAKLASSMFQVDAIVTLAVIFGMSALVFCYLEVSTVWGLGAVAFARKSSKVIPAPSQA